MLVAGDTVDVSQYPRLSVPWLPSCPATAPRDASRTPTRPSMSSHGWSPDGGCQWPRHGRYWTSAAGTSDIPM